jgi:hypothetical protein
MLGGAFDYAVRYPRRLVGSLSRDPAELWDKLCDHVVQQWEYRNPVHGHQASPDWEPQLLAWLGAGQALKERAEFLPLWLDVVRSAHTLGIDVGPESFAGFNDGDRALLRAIWMIVRNLKPAQVVETGVGHGFTSRFILEAMEMNRWGRLSSVDRPPLDPQTRTRVGIAVPNRLRHRWTILTGSSRRRLPGLLSSLGFIDVFIHDSLHTERNVRFELDRAWAVLRPGGFMIVDDVDSNAGFGSFCRTNPGLCTIVCEAEPVRPDERRFNRRGLFAIIMKAA